MLLLEIYENKYTTRKTSQYKKSIKKYRHNSQVLLLLKNVLKLITNGTTLTGPPYHDHALSGNKRGSRDIHIKPDLVLIYQIDTNNKLIIN